MNLSAFVYLITFLSEVQQDLSKLKDVNTQKLNLLRRLNNHAYQAMMWLKDNKHRFKQTVHEPILMTVSGFRELSFINCQTLQHVN